MRLCAGPAWSQEPASQTAAGGDLDAVAWTTTDGNVVAFPTDDEIRQTYDLVADYHAKHLAELGVKLWTAPDAVNAPTVTAALIPDGYAWPEWKEALRRHGLICTGSFGPMDGKVFRLGHMGTQAQPFLMEQALDAIAATLGK